MLFQSAESRYNQWVRDHYRFLLRSAWALTGSRDIAEDVVQDCFANAWKHREQLRDAALARAWLFQIMRRAAFRRAGRQAGRGQGARAAGAHPPRGAGAVLFRRHAHRADGRGAGDCARHRAVAPGSRARRAEAGDGRASAGTRRRPGHALAEDPVMKRDLRPPGLPDSACASRTRAELALAFEPIDAPPHLYRKAQPLMARRSFQRAVLGLLLAGSGTGAVLAMRPPELVRGAIEHEYFERTLRGTFMASAPLLQHLGLAGQQVVPGFPQLMRPCDIDGHLVYHLTTFFEKGGMVTVFAFDKAVALTEGSGWWGNVHWKVITSRDGKPLVLVAQKKQALAVAQSQFGPATDMSPPNSTPTPKETR